MAVVKDILFGKLALQHGVVDQGVLQTCMQEQSSLSSAGHNYSLKDLMTHRGYMNANTAVQIEHQVQNLSFHCPRCQSAWNFNQLAQQSGIFCLVCKQPLSMQHGQRPMSDRMLTGNSAHKPNPRYGLSDSNFGAGSAYDSNPGTRQDPSSYDQYGGAIRPPQQPNHDSQRSNGTQIVYSSQRDSGRDSNAGALRASRTSRQSTGRIVGSSGLIQNHNGQKMVGDYEIVDELGRGAMGVVYRVRSPQDQRVMALKLLIAGNLASETQVERFLREAEITSSLSHPNIVPIQEIGSIDGHPFFTMEFIDGRPLSKLIKRRKLGIRKSVILARDIARALHYAHSQKVIHRDIKPANILIDKQQQPHITDFGLARQLEENKRLTRTGAVIGTPYYMAPEQVEGSKNVGCEADIYALGVVLFEMLTFKLPFKARSQIELSRMILKDPALRPSSIEPAVDRKLDAITLKALAKKPGQRYSSAADFAADLDAYLNGEPIMAREFHLQGLTQKLTSIVLPALVLLVLIGAGVGLGMSLFGDSTVAVKEPDTTKPDTTTPPGPKPKIPAVKDHKQQAQEAFQEAEKLHEKALQSVEPEQVTGTMQSAIEKLNKVLSLNETHTKALLLRGQIYLSLDDKEKAKADFVKVGNHPQALYNLAKFVAPTVFINEDGSENAADYSELLKFMEQASQLESDSPYADFAKAFVMAIKHKDIDGAIAHLKSLFDRYPEHLLQIYNLLGYFYMDKRDFERALSYYTKILKAHPNSTGALGNRTQLLMLVRDKSAALRDSERLTRINPNAHEAYAVQAQIHAQNKDLSKALRKFRKYLSLRTDDNVARLSYATLLDRDRQTEKAIAECENVLKAQPENGDAYKLLADIYLRMGRPIDHDKTLRRAIRAIKNTQKVQRIFQEYAQELLQKQRFDAIYELCNERLRVAPDDELAYIIHGQTLCAAGKVDEGIAKIERALVLKPSELNVWLEYFDVIMKAKRPKLIPNACQQLIKANPQNASAHALASKIYARLRLLDKAQQYLESALRIDQKNPAANLILAKLALDQNKHTTVERIVSMLTASRNTKRPQRSEALSILGASYAQRSQLALAEQQLKQAIEVFPPNVQAHTLLMKIYFNRNRDQLAYRIAVRALKAGLKHPDFFDIMGRIELKQNQTQRALTNFEKALQLTPNNPALYYFYAVCLMRLNEKEQARKMVQRGLSLKPRDPQIRQMLERMLKQINK